MLILDLLINHGFIDKKGYKQDIIGLGKSYYIKIVFTLLTKVIIVYMQFSII